MRQLQLKLALRRKRIINKNFRSLGDFGSLVTLSCKPWKRTNHRSSATGSRSSRMYIGRPLPLGKVWPGSMPSAW